MKNNKYFNYTRKKSVFYNIFVPRHFSFPFPLSSCCLEYYMVEISSCGYYIFSRDRITHLNNQKCSCNKRSSAFFIGMHLGNLRRTRIKTCCNVINTVTLKDVSAGMEETIMSLTGRTLAGRYNLGWKSSLVLMSSQDTGSR